jgi:hypothetical protein
MLLANTLSNGTRGVVAKEERGRFHLGTKVTFNAEAFVVPRDDPQSGKPLSYRLEPFLPTIGYNMGGPGKPAPPLVSFLFPSGELRVTVRRPDGKTDDLGRAPFRTGRVNPVFGVAGQRFNAFGTTSLESLFELTTLDPTFEYQFPTYGHYVVTMEGWTRDATGITYRGGGSYDIYVAKSLDLDLGTFLNTPFEVGDVMSPVVHVRPGVPADVGIDFKLFPNSSLKEVVSKSVVGKANHFGYFNPGKSAEDLKITAPGEYVVDITASYTDREGVLWMGAVEGASVVETPNTSLIAHGKRGIKDPDNRSQTAPVWFFMKKIVPPGLSGEGTEGGIAPQLFYPYHTGDVSWAADAGGAIFPELSLQDDRRVTKLSRRGPGPGVTGSGDVDLGTIGEIDVKLPPIDLPGQPPVKLTPPVQYPELVKTWAYYYTSVQRPGVTVRSLVGSGAVARAYWQFNDPYNAQLGNGENGDFPGDIKLQYGGIVYRDADSGISQYAIYGSMAVMIPAGTALGQRTFPPFQGAAGGPSGGPLLTIKGKEIDIFFTPVGVTPGSVLEVGDTFSFSGAMWPTLPSLVELTVITPSGTKSTYGGRANKIGYFYDPADDFVVSEPGIYTVTVRVTHDGATSAGPVQKPFPTGGVLGTEDGTYTFYVVPKGGSYLAVDTRPQGAAFVGTGFTIKLQPSVELGQVSAHYTTDLTGTVLESGNLGLVAGAFSYVYDPAKLRASFPNLDSGPAGDTVVVSLVVVGKDRSGQPTAFARQVLFQGALVFALAEP